MIRQIDARASPRGAGKIMSSVPVWRGGDERELVRIYEHLAAVGLLSRPDISFRFPNWRNL